MISAKSRNVARMLKMRVNKLAEEAVTKLAEEAKRDAQRRYDDSLYAGTNDVKVDYDKEGRFKATVTATGKAVGFIEFGTGMYPHEKYAAGSYGQGKGANPPWTYYGEPGTMPDTYIVRSGKKGNVVRTYGSPANLCLHLAKQHVQEEAARIVKEVNRS